MEESRKAFDSVCVCCANYISGFFFINNGTIGFAVKLSCKPLPIFSVVIVVELKDIYYYT